MIIQPKPTRYRGVKFRSRLEARWAVMFDYSPQVTYWTYEPFVIHHQRTGWRYTPDFEIHTKSSTLLLEIKPVAITPEEDSYLKEMGSEHNLVLCTGSLWKGRLKFKHYGSTTQIAAICKASAPAMRVAGNWRFDLK